MRQATALILISATTLSAVLPENSMSLEPRWENLEHSNTKEKEFGGKWILVGSLTFCKKSKQCIKLEKITLNWHGNPIKRLQGSLYKKRPDRSFLPIEDNLLCDSNWNRAKQTLTLDFSGKRQTLGPLSIFYLVLTVPESVEPTLKNGYFSIVHNELPHPFDTKAESLKLDLAHLHQTARSTQQG